MLFIAEKYAPLFRSISFTPEMIFTSPDIRPWRKLDDRENCVWNLATPQGVLRLHVKRYHQTPHGKPFATLEAEGYYALESRHIPTATVVTHGILPQGRSFIVTEDLTGFTPADKLIESGTPFAAILTATADLTAKLHTAGLHHRDLYLCHFLARLETKGTPDLRLIDAARVRPLSAVLLRRRWIVKDLSQFWYSTTAHEITDAERHEWLTRYAAQTNAQNIDRLNKSIERKARGIAAHDARLRRHDPHRNISIPERM
jgi:hypothetical protein